MGAFNQLNGAIFDAGAIEARLSAIDGKSIYNQRDGGILDMDLLARRLTALDGKVAVMQGGIEFDVDSLMRRLAAIEAGVFTPLQFYANGEQGGWYDPSDFAAMFQDSAGTTPVTTIGQPVGKILDKSGRGNHLTQATTTSRPTVQQDANGFLHLLLDGVDDNMATAAFSLNSTATMAAAVLLSNAAASAGNIFDGVTNRMIIGANDSPTNTYRAFDGSTLSGGTRDGSNHVVLGNFAGAASSLEVDKISVASGNAGTTGLSGGLQFGSNNPPAGQFLNGRFYGGLVLNRALTATEKSSLYSYLGGKAGLIL